MTFDPQRSSGVKKFHTIRKPINDFLFDFYEHHLSISYRLQDIRLQFFSGFDLNLWLLKVIWGQKFLYHSKAHIWLPIWLLWTPSLYLVPFSRYSTSKFLEFDLDLWSLKFIWGQKISYHSKAHIWLPIWLLWTPSLYLVPSSRFSTSNFFRVWPWPLTPGGHLGSKNFILFESPYVTSYLTSLNTISLSRTVFKIFDFNFFRIWPWPLTLKGHLRSKIFIPFESPYMTSYLTSMNTISLSRTIFEIFDFKVSRVWPWLLIPKGHLGSKNFILFESSYMTSYLTSMNKISLSRTVFEIFDFKIFRVWPWPLTPEGHLGSKKFIPFESAYMTSYLTSMDTISLSRTVLEICDFKVFRVWPWPLTLKRSSGVNKFYTIQKPIYDFLFDFYEHHLSISYRLRDIRLQIFLGFGLDLWPLKVIWGQNFLYYSKAHIWLPIWLLWTSPLYLVPFSRYSTSKFSGFDLDLWPLKVIWGQKNLNHSKAHIWLSIWLLWTPSLYLVPFSRYSTSKFLGFDLDLWPLKVIWGQNFLYHSKAHICLPIWLLWTPSLYLVPFSR